MVSVSTSRSRDGLETYRRSRLSSRACRQTSRSRELRSRSWSRSRQFRSRAQVPANHIFWFGSIWFDDTLQDLTNDLRGKVTIMHMFAWGIKLFMLSNYFRCWCSSSMGKQMIYKFDIIASPVKCPSSLIGSFSLIEIVGRWMSSNRLKLDASKRSSSGWVRLIVWQNAFSIRSSRAVALSKHRKLFVISMPILILPSVSLNTLPGWRGRVSSTLPSSGLSVGLIPLNPRTLWWSRCSWRISNSLHSVVSQTFHR